jgi:hypothetical protein
VDEPFGATVCIQQEGNVACPDAFTDRVVAFRGFMDDRACQQCGCSSPAGASCDGKLTIYSSQNCTGPSYVPPNDGVCHLFDYTSAVKFDSDATGGACTATGGAPKGGIHNAEPVTVCCRPLE